MGSTATIKDAFKLFMDGSIALAQVEASGVRVDVDYLDRAIKETNEKISSLEEKLRSDRDVFTPWRKRYGNKLNLGSREQLAEVLVQDLGFDVKERTEKTGRAKMSKNVLEGIDRPFIKDFLHIEKHKKTLNGFLLNLKREIVGEYFHPNFNIAHVKTFRSSSGSDKATGFGGRDFNIQTIPTKDDEQAETVRRCFIPRKGHQCLSFDFKGIEVSTAACVVGDTLIETIDGPQTIRKVIDRIHHNDEIYLYAYDRGKGRVCVSKVIEGGITRRKTLVWRITLDNGRVVTATPDHKFMLRDGTYVRLSDLKVGDSLMPFYKQTKKSWWGTNYTKIYLNNGSSMMAHNLVALDLFNVDINELKLVVHHWNGKGTDNSLSNIEIMSRSRHMRIHSKQGWKNHPKDGLRDFSYQKSEAFKLILQEIWRNRRETWTEKDWEEHGRRISEGIKRKGGREGNKNAMFGRKQTDATKRKISAAKIGKPRSCPPWNAGLTKETSPSLARAALAKAGRQPWNLGRKCGPLSDECKAKLSKALKGRTFSDSTRKKLSDATKRRWKNNEPETCPFGCGTFKSLGTHFQHKHPMSLREYRKVHNHTVAKIEKNVGREDVFNLTVDGPHNYALSAGVVIKNCLHQDPNMLRYLRDKRSDMHRDTAAEVFMLHPDQISKDVRYTAKNQAVFPFFYGSYYIDCAKALWESMLRKKFRVCLPDDDKKKPTGPLIRRRLWEKGIKELGTCDPKQEPKRGTFEYHLRDIERKFWDEKFPVYRDWKKRWYAQYLERGWFTMLTGFRVEGEYRRNQVVNYPVQGPAFHCLLWCLIQLQRWLVRTRKRSLITAQVHDSASVDAHMDETDEVIAKARQIMSVELPKHWGWITVPFEVEVEIAPEGGSWYDLKPLE